MADCYLAFKPCLREWHYRSSSVSFLMVGFQRLFHSFNASCSNFYVITLNILLMEQCVNEHEEKSHEVRFRRLVTHEDVPAVQPLLQRGQSSPVIVEQILLGEGMQVHLDQSSELRFI